MTKSKRNLLVSVIVLVLTLAIAGGSTFAWFTTNQRVTVDDMNMSVTTGTQGLYVSTNPTTGFKTTLTAQDLLSIGFDPSKLALDNVTSADGMSVTTLTNATASKNVSYGEFSVYFRITGLDATGDGGTTETPIAPKVNVEDLDLIGTASDRLTYSDFDFTEVDAKYGKAGLVGNKIDRGGQIEANPTHAMRMSFATQAFNKTGENLYTETDTARVWDPFYANTATFCGLPNAANGDKLDNKTGNFSLDYYNQLIVQNEGAESTNKLTFPATGIAAIQEKTAFSTNSLKFAWNDTSKAWEGKLTVRMWIEGYDGDCLNAILGGKVVAKMNFVIPKAI